MSHFTRVRTQIVELDYLKRALTDLNYEYQVGHLTVRGFQGRRVAADVVVKTKGYPIGFKKRDDTYDVVADWWGVRGVKRKQFLPQVMQRYAYHAARDKLEAQGFALVSEEVEEKGRVHLVLRRMG